MNFLRAKSYLQIRYRSLSAEGLALKRNFFYSKKSSYPGNRKNIYPTISRLKIFHPTPHIKATSMPNDVNCKCNTVNIVNTDDKGETLQALKVKWIMLMILIRKLIILKFKHLELIGGKILFTQP